MTDRPEDKPSPTSNLFTQTTDFIDRNIHIVKYCTVYGFAGVGVILILRSTYALRKFRDVKDVPSNFVKLHARLHGDVTRLTPKGHLVVNHTPVISLRKAAEGQLPIRLAGVHLNHLAFPWLQEKILNKHIWFQILQVGTDDKISDSHTPSLHITGAVPPRAGQPNTAEINEDTRPEQHSPPQGVVETVVPQNFEGKAPDVAASSGRVDLMVLEQEEVLECIVTAKKGWIRNMVVNEEVVKLGFATVSHIDGLQGDDVVKKLITRLVKAEIWAEKKGYGVWERPSLRERLRAYPASLRSRVIDTVKRTFSWKSKRDTS